MMTTPLTLRPMTVGDLPDVMAIELEAFTNPWSLEMVKKELTQDWSTVLVAEEGHALVGFAIFWVVADEVHVLNVATRADRRRQGIGRVLLDRVLEHGRAKRCRIATLEVRRSNMPAQALYQGHGFRQVALRPRYYADNQEDAVVMVADLGP
jgi:[ribosomal protein S18]-alanine N-acetyltransferase